MKKTKKLIILAIILISVFIIYITTIDKKIYYLSLDIDNQINNNIQKYLKENKIIEQYKIGFLDETDRITDATRKIIDNKKIITNKKTTTIKNALIKADLITISIGKNELDYKINKSEENSLEKYKYIDSFIKDYEEFIKLVKKYCKEDIIIVGILNNYEGNNKIYIDYTNVLLENLAIDYDLHFVNTKDSEKLGYEEIIKIIKTKILK